MENTIDNEVGYYDEKDADFIVSTYGMQYAKAVIIDRAIPSIDGFKPSQRRVLVTMHRMDLYGKKVKCASIVGRTMGLHPHGDGSIYSTMTLMTDNNGTYNIPYVAGKGNFGIIYSRDFECAKMRYTEAGLRPICKELFKNMDSGASEMVPSYDSTDVEPKLLPVKFPSILVNPISGIAVGNSCNIPCFNLVNVCTATAGIIANKIKTPEELASALVCPEYSTGAYIHSDSALMTKLCKTGRARFVISSKAEIYSDRIEITEIPFTTTAEEIVDQVVELMKDSMAKDISDIHNSIGKKGLRIKIMIKRGKDPRRVLEALYRATKLRDSISYHIMIIDNNECIDNIGVLDLLNRWVEYRHKSLIGEFNYAINKKNEEIHKLETWEKIKEQIEEIGDKLTRSSEEDLKKELISEYGLDEIQSEYLLNFKVRSITTDNMKKNLDKLDKARADVVDLHDWVINRDRRNKRIISELFEIADKYGTPAKTKPVDLIVERKNNMSEEISSEQVTIKITRNGYVKRLVTLKDISNFECPLGDRVVRSIVLKNNEHLLVFTCDGAMYKVLADDIDASRGALKEKLAEKIGVSSFNHIVWADAEGDFSGYFNLIYPNGKGERVYYDKAVGKRSKYVGLFTPVEPGKYWIATEDKFFIITSARKAAYIDTSCVGTFSSRRVFRIAIIKSNERIIGVQPLSKVPNKEIIDIDRYNKNYTVAIKNDILWDDSEINKARQEVERLRKEKEEQERERIEKEKIKAFDKVLAMLEPDDEEY